jgi:ADP-ribosyl-[dinitrogen reductase] hydrolase
MEPSIQDRCYGSFFGSIVGDALGAPVEFKARDSFEHITDMKHNYTFDLKAGGWTDDTSMMLCLSESLINNGKIDLKDNLRLYSMWFRKGYLSSKPGFCFDIGKTTSISIRDFEETGIIESKYNSINNSGNGSIMRLTPIPIYYNTDLNKCLEECELSSKSTHTSKLCIEGCKILGCYLYLLINGCSKDTIIDKVNKQLNQEFSEEFSDILSGNFLNKTRKEIKSSGYIIDSLEAALYSFMKFNNFSESVLFAVNLGNDADTVACITGMICGSYYGIRNIPVKWIQILHHQELLWKTIDNLYF